MTFSCAYLQLPLVQAVFNRNADEIQLLLHNKKEDVNALVCLCCHSTGSGPIILLLVLYTLIGANVNAKDHVWLTPLHRAAASRNERAVGLLLRQGAEANARDKFWQTPLHVAAANRATRCAEALLPQLSNLNMADRTGRTALHHAAQSGYMEMVKLLLNKGANLSTNDKRERQPIHWAAYLGHLEVLKLLVSRSADKGCKDKQGYTPLHAAAASGHIDIVKYLLRLGAELDEPNAFGNTALHVACYTGQEAVANELVNQGANVNQPNRSGYTPLHLAAVSTNGALCLELLVNNGADVNQQSNAGKSPLHMAAIHGRFTRSQILIQNGGEIDSVDKYGNTPLHVAAKYGHELLISTLMTNGADTARQGIHGMFPLHLAVLYGFSDCCRKLLSSGQLYSIVSSMSKEHVLSAGFDINTPDNFGRTCLHAAASGGNVECLNLLLSSGTDLNQRDQSGRTPLHYAAANGRYQCTVTLVSAGAEVNEPDRTGCTPLHYSAASQAFCSCLEHLLDNGADPSLVNSKGYSAVHYAASHGNKQNLELLLEMSFNALGDIESSIPVSPLHLAADNGHWQALSVLTETAAYVDVQDASGRSVLYLASQRGYARCVEVLLAQGASCLLNENRHTWTPLHVAGGHTDCVHLLLEKGAWPDAKDKGGSTALHRGVSYTPRGFSHYSAEKKFILQLHLAVVGREDCVTALLDHEASALCRDGQGRTPLHYAASHRYTDILASLLRAATRADPLDSLLDHEEYTPSHWAAYQGHEGCLEVLLEHKTCSSQEGNRFTPLHCALISNDGTPLHAAACAEDVSGLQLVLRHGAEINAVDHTGRSALMVAADNGQSGTVAILLQRAKADLTLLDDNGNTALHLACSKAHEMCALLILGEIHNATLVNATNAALQMPLHLAARNGMATVVQALLSRGATVLAVDEEGHTPALACAPNKDVADCLALILSTMKPFPPLDPSSCSSCTPLPNGNHHGAAIGLDGCLSE
uniref:Ankyrin repeat domain 52a n=1 Tax=Oncorhynchus mykiss TaxID=8022 RepID=A0A8C7R3E1_ONCMY